MKIGSVQSYPNPAQNLGFFHLSLPARIVCAWESRKVLSRLRRKEANVSVFPLKRDGIRPLDPHDIPLVFLTHNNRSLLPSFLKHYRELGATRFLCVDDQSTDGTREALLAEPDVDIFASDLRYRDARRGRLWREALFAMHGEDRWYLNVDSDEYFIYANCEQEPLRAFISALQKRGIERCPAPMIDAYPAGPLNKARFDGTTEHMPWTVAQLFDATGHRLWKGKRALNMRGGMRARVFGADVELVKYPLLFWRKGHGLGVSIHQPAPYHLNFSPICGVLLHFKFFSNTADLARHAVKDRQYFDDAREYKRLLQTMEANDGLSLACETSTPYVGSHDLLTRGFLTSVFA